MNSQNNRLGENSDGSVANSRSEQTKLLVFGLSFLLFSLLLNIPSVIFFANLNEFSLRLADVFTIFGLAWVVSLFIGFGVASLFPKSLGHYVVAVIFALGVLVWIQGSLLVWQYGALDGSDIIWEEFSSFGYIDSLIWLTILGVAIWLPASFVRICRPAAVIVMITQSVLLIFSLLGSQGAQNDPSARNFKVDSEAKYSYSANHNVIMIVLDAFQSDIFAEIIGAEPEYAAALEGFTYFPDAVSGSNYTELAIPALLTGKMFDNSQRREDYLRDAFLNHGVTTIAKNNGYVVDIYPWMGWGNESIYFDETIASNLTKIDSQVNTEPAFSKKKAKEALRLLDLSLFRAAPHFLKTFVYNDQRWFATYIASFLVPEEVKNVIATDNQFEIGTFFENAPAELRTDRGARVFKYYHLKGAHSPLTVDEELNFTDQIFPFNKGNYINQAKANLIYLAKFFEKLKQVNIYDNSLILVLGDHGSGDSAEMYIEPPGASRKPYRLDGTKRNFRRDKAKAIPLVLIKRIGASGNLETSGVSVSLMDIPGTIYTETGIQSDSIQPSVFREDAPDSRVRYHSAFEFSPNKAEYVDDITVYRIEGDSWSNDSWSVFEIQMPDSHRDANEPSE